MAARQRVMGEVYEHTRSALDTEAEAQKRNRSQQIEHFIEAGLAARGYVQGADGRWKAPAGAPWRPPVV